jgi:O-antigen ligase
MWLGIVFVAVVLAAPLISVEWLIAAHLLVASGRWADLPPAGWGLPLLTFAALASNVLCRTIVPPRFAPHPRRNYRTLHLATLLLGVEIVSLLWTPSLPYAVDKIIRFGLLDIAAAYAACAALQTGMTSSTNVFRALRWSTLALSVAGLALAVVSGAASDDRLAFGQTDPITFGTIAGAGVLFWSLASEKGVGFSLGRSAAILVCAAALIGSNSKGPVIATAIGFLVITIRNWRSARAWTGLLIAGAVGSLIFLAAPSEYTSRFDPGLYEQNDPHITESVSLRQRFGADALRQFEAHPLIGSGSGGFNTTAENGWGAPLPRGSTTVLFPHSLPLEVAAELGVVGLAALTLLGFAAARDAFNRKVSNATLALIGLSAVEALFSGDISDQRFLYFAMAFAAAETTLQVYRTPQYEWSRP